LEAIKVKKYGIISPQDWNLAANLVDQSRKVKSLTGFTIDEIDHRIKSNLYQWLPRQFDPENHAFFGFYRATDGYREPPQTVNLIITWELMAAYDRYGDQKFLDLAHQALGFYYQKFIVNHPMSTVRGGARDGVAASEIWTKFSAEFVIGSLGYYERSKSEEWLEHAEQSGRYLLQAARHGFAPKYRLDTDRWVGTAFGWDSWGRVIEACLQLEEVTGNEEWSKLALRWGEHALVIQRENGCFYLINQEYYNTDLAADEIRGLLFLYERFGEQRFLDAGLRFADWHLSHQLINGAWSMTSDNDGNLVVPTIGPGDIPNIAIALLRAHQITGKESYLEAALKAFKYSFSKQVLPASDQLFPNDPNILWGFWSWDPQYDYTVSGDQATHHIRGMMFLLDYLCSLGKQE